MRTKWNCEEITDFDWGEYCIIRTRLKMQLEVAFYHGVYGWRLGLDDDGIGVPVLRLYKYYAMLDEGKPRNGLFPVVEVQNS